MEIIYLYCAFSYLFMIGFEGVSSSGITTKISGVILAPFIMPVEIGMALSTK